MLQSRNEYFESTVSLRKASTVGELIAITLQSDVFDSRTEIQVKNEGGEKIAKMKIFFKSNPSKIVNIICNENVKEFTYNAKALADKSDQKSLLVSGYCSDEMKKCIILEFFKNFNKHNSLLINDNCQQIMLNEFCIRIFLKDDKHIPQGFVRALKEAIILKAEYPCFYQKKNNNMANENIKITLKDKSSKNPTEEEETSENENVEDMVEEVNVRIPDDENAEDSAEEADVEISENENAEDSAEEADVEISENENAEDSAEEADVEISENENAEDSAEEADVEISENENAEDSAEEADAEISENKNTEKPVEKKRVKIKNENSNIRNNKQKEISDFLSDIREVWSYECAKDRLLFMNRLSKMFKFDATEIDTFENFVDSAIECLKKGEKISWKSISKYAKPFTDWDKIKLGLTTSRFMERLDYNSKEIKILKVITIMAEIINEANVNTSEDKFAEEPVEEADSEVSEDEFAEEPVEKSDTETSEDKFAEEPVEGADSEASEDEFAEEPVEEVNVETLEDESAENSIDAVDLETDQNIINKITKKNMPQEYYELISTDNFSNITSKEGKLKFILNEIGCASKRIMRAIMYSIEEDIGFSLETEDQLMLSEHLNKYVQKFDPNKWVSTKLFLEELREIFK